MDVKELYQILDANYEEISTRLMEDDIIKRSVFQFKDTNPFPEIQDAYREHDVVRLFDALHTLKEIVEELSLNKLLEITSMLCEVTRYKNVFDDEVIGPLMQTFVQEYNHTISCINELE